ncbi:DUF7502 family protein [Halorussus halobius]|uniref:DUF7502 family protein n=1 Tax=Halorussus halobius TaxID=1710537 RepID=UPI0010930E93|nr:hypothetical protein [Halorussus halobius]
MTGDEPSERDGSGPTGRDEGVPAGSADSRDGPDPDGRPEVDETWGGTGGPNQAVGESSDDPDEPVHSGGAAGDDGRVPDDPAEAKAGDARADDVRSALAEVRREQYKVAVVHASLEAACLALAVNLLAGVVGVPALDAPVLPSAFESSGVPAPDVGTAVALLAGVAAFAAGVGLRARRPAVESFEAANPEVAEALRTARDAVGDDRANPMALALYDDVLDRLRGTSSVRLVDRRRLVASVAVAFALGLASVQTAVVGVDLAGPPSDAAVGGTGDSEADRAALENGSTPTLRDGDELLGEPSEVDAGSENLTASVGSSPGGEGDEARNYDSDGSGSDGGAVAPERAGFDSPERVEDADLVARYARELEGNQTDDR